MQFRHVIHEKCPVCGAALREARVFGLHCNGNWNEEKVFECYRREAFSPNFMEIRIINQCERSPNYKEDCRKEEILIDKIRKMVAKADAPEKYRNRIIENLKYL